MAEFQVPQDAPEGQAPFDAMLRQAAAGADTLETVARKAVAAHTRGVDLVITAATLVTECRARVDAGEYQGTWSEFCTEHLPELKERRIRELLAIGRADDPAEALAISRKTKAESVRKARENNTEPDVEPALRSAAPIPCPYRDKKGKPCPGHVARVEGGVGAWTAAGPEVPDLWRAEFGVVCDQVPEGDWMRVREVHRFGRELKVHGLAFAELPEAVQGWVEPDAARRAEFLREYAAEQKEYAAEQKEYAAESPRSS